MSFLSLKQLLQFSTLPSENLSNENSLSLTSLSSASSTQVSSNIDLLRQILVCLPVKSLLKFKSISKEWLSIISSQDFIRDHYLVRNRSFPLVPRLFILQVTVGFSPKSSKIKSYYGRQPSGIIPFKTFVFFLHERKFSKSSAAFETLAFNNDPSDIKIIHSCNGLFICRSYRTYYGDFNYDVYNPSTKCFKPLHPSPFRKSSVLKRICSVNMVFDPLRSNYYEVIFIWSSNDGDTFQIETYSSKTGSWRLHRDGFSAPVNMFCSPAGVFWNGSLHWINRECSLYFNASQESLKTMPSPPIPADGFDSKKVKCEYFGACNGHMYFVEVHHSNPTQFDILEMDIDYTGWTVKYHVDLQELAIAYPKMVRADYDFSILLIEEDDVSSNILINIPDKIISYDLKEMSFKKLHDLPSIPTGGAQVTAPRYSAYRYDESLACV
ncbi:F-box protein At5g07610-like [Papaver somniferum]|uniref:F-box protein At5g07610-like n=1 Tax=Papaver somniferum TaxID=3469 RepID=UPI000E6F778C|nr:F-box protein At5g07610-like [Papaver somniferum]